MGLGLVNAVKGAASSVWDDSWREYFYCDSLPDDILLVKGSKRTTSRSSNKKGDDNIISNGSIVAVNEGQCMLIVEQGAVVDVCAEAGEFVYDKSTEPSLYYGNLGKGIIDTFKTIGRRFTFGGDTAKDQRVYYINIKEIKGNKYGTAQPISFRLVDENSGIDWDIPLRCNGLYSYKIVNPLIFYKEITGNSTSTFNRSELAEPLREEVVDELANVFGDLSMQAVRYGNINKYKDDVVAEVIVRLNERWGESRGLELSSLTLNPTISEEDRERINEMQRLQTMTDPSRLAASYVQSKAEAMKLAAQNEAGAMMGFMGMNMASMAGGNDNTLQNLFGMNQQGQQMPQQGQQTPQQGQGFFAHGQAPAAPAQPEASMAPEADTWTCSCGTKNTGKFCVECGAKKPEPAAAGAWTCKCGTQNTGKFCVECGSPKPESGWTCKCGALNKGKFCMECGAKKPAGALLYRCDKCGWEPEDPTNPPKFCPECADPFNEDDIKN
ncbi:MAG: SPFH domain-containing protein [Lachnospiraceae bacterium]|nr:SPFH domain-containing protein [Lachnospiraceae bacterium]